MDELTVIKTDRKELAKKAFAIGLCVLLLVCGIACKVFAADADAGQIVYAAEKNRSEKTAAEIYAENVGSTVGITTESSTNLFGYETVSAASGSGFIITENGHILTNYHVVEGSEKIKVTLYSDESFDAELIGYDESNDIAVLKIEAEGLTPVTFGESSELVVGESVIAIGNPLGELTFSLTTGVVSALNRDITLSDGVRMKLIQTDCAINSGNSGGALFNMYGEVVGITNAKYSGSGLSTSVDNIAFAIPIDSIANIVEQILVSGEISSPYIGLTINTVGEDLTAYGVPQGANVYSVTEDSPAAEAGLQQNDVITAADGKEITCSDDLSDYIKSLSAGDKVTLSVYRQGEIVEIEVTVGENVKSALPETDTEDSANESTNPNTGMEQFFTEQFGR